MNWAPRCFASWAYCSCFWIIDSLSPVQVACSSAPVTILAMRSAPCLLRHDRVGGPSVHRPAADGTHGPRRVILPSGGPWRTAEDESMSQLIRRPGRRTLLAGGALLAALALPASAIAATLVGTAGPDHLVGTAGPDTISGLAGDDVLYGAGGDDHVYGGAGAAVSGGGAGADYLSGGPGPDTIRGGAGNDVISGGDGNEVIYGGA